MQVEIKIEQCEKNYCVIHAQSESDGIKEIAQKISMMDANGKNTVIPGWDGDYCIQVKQQDLLRIYSLDKKVYLECQTEKEPLLLKIHTHLFIQSSNIY